MAKTIKEIGDPDRLVAERETLSVCVITYNEADNISECLESVRWADEIIVVDSNSTDKTVEIARRFTDKVLLREWPGHVAQKNFAADQAGCDWILAVDADERVSTALRDEILQVLKKRDRGQIGFCFPRKNHYLGRWWTHGGWYPDLKLRLWRRGRGRWGGNDPHDHVVLQGLPGRLSGDLLHYSYRSITDHVVRMNSYSTIAARAKEEKEVRYHLLDLLVRPPWRFFRMYLLKSAWRDGIAGLTIAGIESFYVFLKYAKLWERQKLERGQGGDTGQRDPKR